MDVEYIGGTSAAVTASLPAFTEAGDVLLLFAFRDGSTTAPTLAAGWTDLGTQAGTTCSARLAYKIATGTSEAASTWTNATSIVVQVYRGSDPADQIGSVVPLAGTSSNAVQFPGITLSDTSGTSWIAAFVGHRSTAPNLAVAPTGFTNRILVSDATDEAAGHDTNGGVTGFAGQTVTVGGGSAQGWITYVVEIRAAPASARRRRVVFVTT